MFRAHCRTKERPGCRQARCRDRKLALEALETRRLLAFNPYTVTTNADTGFGSLRDAITQVDAGTYNEILFDITAGSMLITPQSPLPPITAPVIIDGYSQPLTSQNSNGLSDNAVLVIQIDGSTLAAKGYNQPAGLEVESLDTTIDGLSITDFGGPAISLQPPASPPAAGASAIGDVIWGNFLGLAPAGTALPDLSGVIVNTTNNLIGGTTAPARNVIESNDLAGVILYGANGSNGMGNLVEGNSIVDNGGDGVLVLSANNVVGGATSGQGNQISGNTGDGVDILGTEAAGNVVAGNTIGGALNSSLAPNGGQGVMIENSPGNLVGGPTSGSSNVIAGNTGNGVNISNFDSAVYPLPAVPIAVATAVTLQDDVNAAGDNATGNLIEANTIGYDDQAATEFPVPNLDGVFIASSGNTVGGTTSADANTIIGDDRNGVTISPDQLDRYDSPSGTLDSAAPDDNVVEGNFIGTDASSDDAGNTLDGVFLYSATGNTIGGSRQPRPTSSRAITAAWCSSLGQTMWSPPT